MLGWVGSGSRICAFSRLGWVMGLKLHNKSVTFPVLATPSLTLGLDCRARKWNRLNLFVGGCVQGSYDDCTAIGDEVVIMIMMMLSMVTA